MHPPLSSALRAKRRVLRIVVVAVVLPCLSFLASRLYNARIWATFLFIGFLGKCLACRFLFCTLDDLPALPRSSYHVSCSTRAVSPTSFSTTLVLFSSSFLFFFSSKSTDNPYFCPPSVFPPSSFSSRFHAASLLPPTPSTFTPSTYPSFSRVFVPFLLHSALGLLPALFLRVLPRARLVKRFTGRCPTDSDVVSFTVKANCTRCFLSSRRNSTSVLSCRAGNWVSLNWVGVAAGSFV